MALALFVLSLLILASLWMVRRPTLKVTADGMFRAGASLVFLCVLGIGSHFLLKTSEIPKFLIGIGLGGLMTMIAAYGDRLEQRGLVGLAFGCLVSGVYLVSDRSSLDILCLATILGSGAVAALVGTLTSTMTAITVAAVSLVCLLGHSKSEINPSDYAAPIGVGVCTLVALLGWVAPAIKRNAPIWAIVCAVTGGVALTIIGRYSFPNSADWFGLLATPIIAVVIYWLDTSNRDRPKFGLALTTLMWIGLATVAFGIERGEGTAIAFLVSAGILLMLESDRVLLSSGPLMALAFHRAFRADHPSVGGAIDIGQHYALIGFTIAALLPLLPKEWLDLHATLRAAVRTSCSFIWLLVCLAAPCLVALFLAPKGLLGFVTGLGFCGYFGLSSAESKGPALAVAAAIGAASILEYEFAEKFSDLARSDKIHWFLVASAVLLLIAIVLGTVSTLESKRRTLATTS